MSRKLKGVETLPCDKTAESLLGFSDDDFKVFCPFCGVSLTSQRNTGRSPSVSRLMQPIRSNPNLQDSSLNSRKSAAARPISGGGVTPTAGALKTRPRSVGLSSRPILYNPAPRNLDPAFNIDSCSFPASSDWCREASSSSISNMIPTLTGKVGTIQKDFQNFEPRFLTSSELLSLNHLKWGLC